jgi:flagellar biosynthesis protein FlhA
LAAAKIDLKGVFRPQDLTVAGVLLLIVGIMLIPIPELMLDLLMVFSIGAAFAMLLLSLFINRALDFLSYPSLLLVLTLHKPH